MSDDDAPSGSNGFDSGSRDSSRQDFSAGLYPDERAVAAALSEAIAAAKNGDASAAVVLLEFLQRVLVA